MHCRLPIFDCRLECQLSDSPNRQLAIGNSEGWLRGRDLNPRPLGYEPNELPDCSTPRHLVRTLRRLDGSGRGEGAIIGSRLASVKGLRNPASSIAIPRRTLARISFIASCG